MHKLHIWFWKTCFLGVCVCVFLCPCAKRDWEKGVQRMVLDQAMRPSMPVSVPLLVSLCTGATSPSLGKARTMGCGRPSPHFVHPPDESAAGSAAWRPRLPGPGRWEKPSSWCSGFFLLSRPGPSGVLRLLRAGPAARGPRRAGRFRSRRARGPARLLRRRARGAAARLARPAAVLAGAPRPFLRPPTSRPGDSGPWRARVGGDLGLGVGPAAAPSRRCAPRV